MRTGFIAGVLSLLALMNCQSNTNHEKQTAVTARTERAKITFVELGSVKCIPCKAMQPVMESIEKKYGDQIEVIFYDVWQPDQKKYAQQYNIKLIPTQVFLDENGKEIMRHEGFFAEKEIDAFLQEQGLTPNEESSL